MTTALFEVINKPIDVEEVRQKVLSRNAGAITLFIGTVREITNGKKTLHLEYQAYPAMAIKMFEQIAQEIQEQWPEAKVAITHRVGHLDIADIAVVIAVSSPHRKVAYMANEYAIDRIKQIVPIWKKEHWEDGTEWIGDQLENVPYPQGEPGIQKEENRD
ncbi:MULTISPECIES: molybdenum cofactor biosynthesis protein MoaE [Lysinibacillus]|uniref:Molybdopterin synthase catalytic subunit n=1 Tax=Lysinibacillus fusiformis TaxID=28031 RepID=A0A2I0V047_9BACI|nr:MULTISPECIES: molybdenum cofactor biosynthesis protein MoaE [Lysinibacillus]MEE3806283.1 molybdenum cofactor biosynthesis protein MoaE [Lysinibacillus fusiformis]PKU51698.1 molybdenum cofactor biosynthesis protein MoaE [Lysinibacillus fusiformis]SCY32490.1 molybdopterin synthase catalytic subunit [Lysinibacillus sp. SG9]SDB17095.1 molybdopterin synthase catalytic subunit [Lysinibacillus sp. TC-37]SFS64249.1 molybdopterin synthase catalytic subunit [Lysinibacillus sp. SG55]